MLGGGYEVVLLVLKVPDNKAASVKSPPLAASNIQGNLDITGCTFLDDDICPGRYYCLFVGFKNSLKMVVDGVCKGELRASLAKTITFLGYG